MTDDELLRLAAIAAGYEVNACVRDGIMVRKSPAHRGYFLWSPLKDDSDAFKLAMCLPGVEIAIDDRSRRTVVTVNFGRPVIESWDDASEHARNAAARRAIVRAAAEIGAKV